jgi:hypothetical protein
VSEFRPTSLLMLAASIVPADPWVMAASARAVTLTPLRMLSPEECPTESQRVLVSLTDLGYVGRADRSPLASQPDVVLLLPWSMASTIAELDLAARNDVANAPATFAPEDWIMTWHHFIDVADSEASREDTVRRADLLRALPFSGIRRFVLGERIGDLPADWAAAEGHLARDGDTGDGVESSALAERLQVPNPLVFSNPGSAPEGLSPLFRNGHLKREP